MTETLADIRNLWHFALQPVAAAGFAFAEPKPDDSHSNVLWHPDRTQFHGRELSNGVTLVFDTTEFEIEVFKQGEMLDEEQVAGHTLKTLHDAVKRMLVSTGLDGDAYEVPPYDLPEHPLGKDETFSKPKNASSLADIYTRADTYLQPISAAFPNASEVRIWPHHFDIAVLISLDPDDDSESARSVGVGLSPGDGSYDAPYFYVSPWPYPDAESLPELTSPFRWHTDGFTAAVAPFSDVQDADALRRVTDTVHGIL